MNDASYEEHEAYFEVLHTKIANLWNLYVGRPQFTSEDVGEMVKLEHRAYVEESCK